MCTYWQKLSAHATARLLEQRRDVDIERLLAEELHGIPLHRLIDARLEDKLGDIRFSTTNGEFRFDRDNHETLVAVTWVATARRTPRGTQFATIQS